MQSHNYPHQEHLELRVRLRGALQRVPGGERPPRQGLRHRAVCQVSLTQNHIRSVTTLNSVMH